MNDSSNLFVACNKCNMQKSHGDVEEFVKKNPRRPVKGKYGEPKYWDGFASLFLIHARDDLASLTPNERKWFDALE